MIKHHKTFFFAGVTTWKTISLSLILLILTKEFLRVFCGYLISRIPCIVRFCENLILLISDFEFFEEIESMWKVLKIKLL